MSTAVTRGPVLARRLVAEGLGTALLLATVVGSGIMAERMSGGNDGIALLANAWATGFMLAVLIFMFGPISGAHFNPAVTMAFGLRGQQRWPEAGLYMAVQCLTAVAGVWLAHAMFAEPVLQLSTVDRHGVHLLLSEALATFGLVLVILAGVRYHVASVPWLVGAYIAAAYWFTASTSFANPAVTIARALTDTFAGINPVNVLAFIGAQLVGGVAAVGLAHWLYADAPAGGR